MRIALIGKIFTF